MVLRKLAEPGVLEHIAEKGQYLRDRLQALDEVEEVSGLGMMIGISLKTKKAPGVLKACLDKGLLVLTAKEKVRLLPPLTISQEELQAGTDILCDVLEG